ncbi:MAG: hypothetical protein L0G59_00330 [Kocuria sp.]|nr:hypothetical protein [Kocuria sp.]
MNMHVVPVLPRPAGFVAAATALISIFFSSGIPVPLYNLFRVSDGITNADLALTTVCYLGVTALSLLVFGRLSNHIGRRPGAFDLGALVATWSFTGFCQTFAAGLTADYLGTSNALMVAVVFAPLVVLSPFGGAWPDVGTCYAVLVVVAATLSLGRRLGNSGGQRTT